MRRLLLDPILNCRLLLLVVVLLERRIGGIDHRSILRILGTRPPKISANVWQIENSLQLGPGTEERLGVEKLIQLHLVPYPFPMNT
jgi:hypothetical protein